jgi:hypothetical protein
MCICSSKNFNRTEHLCLKPRKHLSTNHKFCTSETRLSRVKKNSSSLEYRNLIVYHNLNFNQDNFGGTRASVACSKA